MCASHSKMEKSFKAITSGTEGWHRSSYHVTSFPSGSLSHTPFLLVLGCWLLSLVLWCMNICTSHIKMNSNYFCTETVTHTYTHNFAFELMIQQKISSLLLCICVLMAGELVARNVCLVKEYMDMEEVNLFIISFSS